MISYVINLFGAPGTGKSTLAAGLVHQLKMDGHEAILIPELFKATALRGTAPTYRTELTLLGRQIELEADYYGTARFIIAECPLEMHAFYADYGHVASRAETNLSWLANAPVTNMVQRLRRETLDIALVNYLLTPGSFAYSESGRYQTEGESRRIGSNLASYLHAIGLDFQFVYADVCAVKYRIYDYATT